MTPETARQILISDDLPESDGKPSTPLELAPSRYNGPSPAAWVDDHSTEKNYHEISHTPPSTSKVPRFGHPLENSLRRKCHQRYRLAQVPDTVRIQTIFCKILTRQLQLFPPSLPQSKCPRLLKNRTLKISELKAMHQMQSDLCPQQIPLIQICPNLLNVQR